MKKMGILGFGRFGTLLASLASSQLDVHIVESNERQRAKAASIGYKTIAFDSLSQMDFIFLAVPISEIEAAIIKLAPIVRPEQVVIDLCSVKTYPANLLRKHLQTCQTLATHPMFGPDSAKQGLDGLQVAFCPLTVSDENVKIIESFWTDLGAVVIRTTPEAHDRDSVYSQAFTYSIAKVILGMHLRDITFRTRSFEAISQVARLSAKDTEQLFHDMLFYNPYFKHMKAELESSMMTTKTILDAIESEQAAAKMFS